MGSDISKVIEAIHLRSTEAGHSDGMQLSAEGQRSIRCQLVAWANRIEEGVGVKVECEREMI